MVGREAALESTEETGQSRRRRTTPPFMPQKPDRIRSCVKEKMIACLEFAKRHVKDSQTTRTQTGLYSKMKVFVLNRKMPAANPGA